MDPALLGGAAGKCGGSVAVTRRACSDSKMPPYAHVGTYGLDVIAWGMDAAVRGIRATIAPVAGYTLQVFLGIAMEAVGLGGIETPDLSALLGHCEQRRRLPRNERGDWGGVAVHGAAVSRRGRGWQMTVRGDLLGTIVGIGSNLHTMPKWRGPRLRLRLLWNRAECTIDIRINERRGSVEPSKQSSTGADTCAAMSGDGEHSLPAPCQKAVKAALRGPRMAPTTVATGRVRQPRPRRAKGADPKPLPLPPGIPRDADKGIPLLSVRDERRTFDDLIVADDTRARLERIVKEDRVSEALLHYGLRPTSRILLCGPPGTGKTLTAGVLAAATGRRLIHVVFDSLVSPYLGETASNLRRVFEFAATGRFVVLFDEFDIVGRHRDDPHEHGEIKRLVGNFMQMMDDFKGESIIVAATNHQHLLDRALWRRFDEVVYYDNPDQSRRERLLEMYLGALKKAGRMPYKELAAVADGFSAADIAKAGGDALRDAVVGGRDTVDEAGVRRAIGEQRRRMLAAVGG